MFGWEMRSRRKRMCELAGMLKEKGKGTAEELQTLLTRFSIKVGITEEKAREYLEQFEKCNLILFKYGAETWMYNPEIEHEIFGIII